MNYVTDTFRIRNQITNFIKNQSKLNFMKEISVPTKSQDFQQILRRPDHGRPQYCNGTSPLSRLMASNSASNTLLFETLAPRYIRPEWVRTCKITTRYKLWGEVRRGFLNWGKTFFCCKQKKKIQIFQEIVSYLIETGKFLDSDCKKYELRKKFDEWKQIMIWSLDTF